jgi:hypothetical protein
MNRWARITLDRSVARALLWSGFPRDKDADDIIARDKLVNLDEEYRLVPVPIYAHKVVLGGKGICYV